MYAAITDMISRFGEREIIALTDTDGSAGAVVESRLEAALDDAVNTIHGYLAARYSVPFNPAPHQVIRWTCDLARWFLQPNMAPELVKINYERTMAELDKTSKGEIILDAPEKSTVFSGAVEMDGPPRLFKNMKGF